ncbi:MAG TPA: hydantoinase/oxoprolinase family protein [Solirubrobacteraceae bacterium]|nr:hydantoinase/oxoprolinase family protein [Solirubrobacteraceae bacterium]
MLLGVDVGGTFTDAVLALDGRLVTAKAPTTPEDQSQGVLSAVEAVLERAGATPDQIQAFSHGMTVATNALLEGRCAPTALIATEGFTDLVELARQNRPELYRLCAERPRPLVPQELRFPAAERMTPDGPLRSLEDKDVAALVSRVRDAGVEAVAVILLHSYRHPQHELKLGDALAGALPDVHVSLSHEVVGTFREYERAATTEIDAALSPLLAGYLRQLASRVEPKGLPRPAIMQSNGGLIDLEAAAGHAAWTVLSGPAGGAAGAAYVARSSGEPRALCFDMGGTSCDVCVVEEGLVQERGSGEIAGRPLGLPMLAVHTVGAGGGSIAWRDPGGALRVGPRSAGADPGPAAYGRGGTEPTVTDANLLLGYLDSDSPLAGGVRLDRAGAERAVTALASELAMDPLDCAEGIRRIAGAEMVRALRVVTVQRGIDPRRFALLAFGGAGPLHAAQIAEELGIEKVLCPRASGVLAAVGLVVSPRRRDAQRSLLWSGAEITADAIEQAASELGEQARRALGEPQADLEATFEMRYRGQSFELPVTGDTRTSPEQLRDAFERQHEERYGYHDPEQTLELVTLRVTATTAGADVQLAPPGSDDEPRRARRAGRLGSEALEFEVLGGALPPGAGAEGPAVIELPESTVLVPPGWSAQIDRLGSVRLERSR